MSHFYLFIHLRVTSTPRCRVITQIARGMFLHDPTGTLYELLVIVLK